MRHNFYFTDVNEALPQLMHDLLHEGEEFDSRAGRTLELTHVGITLAHPWQREIVLPERKANVAAQIVETMWVLSGRNDVAGLLPYLPRAADFSDDGKEWRAGYGPRLRNYHGVDQLAYVVDTMKSNPGSRQAVATLWDPVVDTTPGKDIACNNWLSFSSRFGVLDLHVGIRSNDAMWGWSGINAFEWSALLELVAGLAGLQVGALHFSVTSFHLYEQHWDKARRLAKTEGDFSSFSPSPRFDGVGSLQRFDELAEQWFELEHLIRTGQNVGVDVAFFPEPMLRSWLQVLQWYWSGNEGFLPSGGNQLYEACKVSLKPPGEPQSEQLQMEIPGPDLLDHINKLHAEKHAAYGDSWCRRGEAGILANIARKVDRIGTGLETSDEAQIDTAIDLVVYLAKYRLWLDGFEATPAEVGALLETVPGDIPATDFNPDLDRLFTDRTLTTSKKAALVESMLDRALNYAQSLWR